MDVDVERGCTGLSYVFESQTTSCLFVRTGAVAVLHLATSSHPQQAGDGLMDVTFLCQDIFTGCKDNWGLNCQELPRLWAKCSQAPRAS